MSNLCMFRFRFAGMYVLVGCVAVFRFSSFSSRVFRLLYIFEPQVIGIFKCLSLLIAS